MRLLMLLPRRPQRSLSGICGRRVAACVSSGEEPFHPSLRDGDRPCAYKGFRKSYTGDASTTKGIGLKLSCSLLKQARGLLAYIRWSSAWRLNLVD